MKVRISSQLMALFLSALTFSLCAAGSLEFATCTPPPPVSDEELSEICTWDDLGYKIHGKNGQETKFKCKSFEKDLKNDKRRQYNAVKYGYFSKFSYYGKSDYVNDIKSQAGADASRYELLSDSEVEKLLSETSLTVKDGSIISKKDERLYEKDEKKGKLDGHAEAGSTRFDAKIFVTRDANGKITEAVIAYRGTQFKNPRDWWDDVKQAAGGVPEQYKQASELLASVLSSELLDGAQIVCTGHSLGGGLATYAMADNDLQGRVTGYTYDAAGLSGRTLNSLKDNTDRVIDAAQHITNIRAEKDPVSYVGYHLGEMYEIEIGEDSVVNNHDLDKLIRAMEEIITKNPGKVPVGDPFDSDPEDKGDGNGQMCPVPGNGSTGGQGSTQPTTRRRGGSGGGDTSSRIW